MGEGPGVRVALRFGHPAANALRYDGGMEEQGDSNRELSQNEVIGRVLKEIWQVGTLNDNGLDWATTYFLLDSGVSFCLPWEGANGLAVEPIPSNAEPLTDARLDQVIGNRIAALLRARPDSEVPSESLYLLLENGFLVSDVIGGWHGTAGVGVFIRHPDEFDGKQFETLWK
jgi:hypothetical protein